MTGSAVFDHILHNGAKVPRMLPSTLDVLFALGNNAAGELLRKAPPAGNHSARWDGRDAREEAVPSGVYFYTLRVGEEAHADKVEFVAGK